MCQFLSGLVTIEKHPKVLCLDLTSHDATLAILKLKPETYREFEWTREDTGDSLDIRVMPGEDRNEFKSAILAKFPRRIDCINDCIRQMAESGRNLNYDLHSLTSAEGLKLPDSIGGWLDLRSLTSAEGLKLPDSIGGGLDLRSLTSAEGLKLPDSIGGWLYLSSLTSAEGLKLPDSIGGGSTSAA
ncbi:hypothetical protein [Mesoterricola silvestris]|uniref:Uncharacterized protein n=1 Tax=Mesoterricola silvestris TaxID=2927979 RepID=A0AA48GMP7_9BACT|nr:hypothetical protein [Mesoterricola silvestris]BDU72340.1 hypothetical protein METEAL_15140 [Mesoterricola silvestris]